MRRKFFPITAIVLIAVLVLGAAALYIAAAKIYRTSFNRRYGSAIPLPGQMEKYPAMTRTRHTFEAMQGHTLVGYLYTDAQGAQSKAMVVFAHGLGEGGQSGYLEIYDYLVRSGYCVFAYDATANDESEGEALGGLPQGIADMDHAVTYAQNLPETVGLPLVLMGYSWGGLSASNTLNTHPEAAATVAMAGWNDATDLVVRKGTEMLGSKMKLVLPFLRLYERVTYRQYAAGTAMSGFAKSEGGVMIVHGELDGTVPIEYGYDLYYETYAEDARFSFVRYPDRGHLVYKQSGRLDEELMAQVVAFCDKWVS